MYEVLKPLMRVSLRSRDRAGLLVALDTVGLVSRFRV